MRKDIVRQIVVVIALVSTLVMNYLANALPINGQSTADVANRLPIYFVPANYVFSIWGVIYLFLTAYAVYQALPSQRENPRLRRIGYLFVLASVANCIWIVLFQYEYFALTMVAILVLLGSLITIYLRLAPERGRVSRTEFWLVYVTFSIYLAWVTVATIANASYALYDGGYQDLGLGGAVWAALLILIAAAITVAMLVRHRDFAFAAVIVWALVGIFAKQSETQMVYLTALLATIVVLACVVWVAVTHKGLSPAQA